MSTPVAVPPGFTDDFGPDVPAEPSAPKVNQDKPPRKARETRAFKLGGNRKPRSGIRQLTDDDRPKVAQIYQYVATAAQFVKPELAAAIMIPAIGDQPSQIDKCVDAWFVLAEDNDRVRSGILALIEGGGWGKLIMCHVPLFIAVLPRQFVERFMNPDVVMSILFGQSTQDEPQFPQYPADMQRDPNT